MSNLLHHYAYAIYEALQPAAETHKFFYVGSTVWTAVINYRMTESWDIAFPNPWSSLEAFLSGKPDSEQTHIKKKFRAIYDLTHNPPKKPYDAL